MAAPWERYPNESDKAYEAFLAYLDMAPGERSLSAVGQKLNKSNTLMARWASKYDWVARVGAYADEQRAQEEAAREEANKAEAVRWAERRKVQREREWALSERLQARAEEMLAYPLTFERREVKETDENGSPTLTVIQISPAEWAARDAARFLELSSKLARLAAEMDTERGRQTITGEDGESIPIAIVKMDMSKL